MTDQFRFTQQGRNLFFNQLKTLITETENGGSSTNAYKFSDAEIGESGYTIGIHQFDLHSRGNESKARTRLAELGFNEDEIAVLTAKPDRSNPITKDWNNRLTTVANRRINECCAC